MDVANRTEIERRLARVLSKDLRGELDKLMQMLGNPPSLSNVPAEYWNNGWRSIQKDVEPILLDVYLNQAQGLMTSIGIGVDWGIVNNTAANWARTQSEQLLKQMFNKTYEGVGQSVSRYFESEWSIDDLSTALEHWYSPVRAEMIAVTETTRAASEGEAALMDELNKETGVQMVEIWLTANDESVCDICGPRHEQPIVNGDRPPAHPNCRCMIGWEHPKKEKK